MVYKCHPHNPGYYKSPHTLNNQIFFSLLKCIFHGKCSYDLMDPKQGSLGLLVDIQLFFQVFPYQLHPSGPQKHSWNS